MVAQRGTRMFTEVNHISTVWRVVCSLTVLGFLKQSVLIYLSLNGVCLIGRFKSVLLSLDLR